MIALRIETATVYLDESGDLGWKFNQPYRCGGSSRYLTVAATIAPQTKSHLPGREVRTLYKRFKWSSQEEKKWATMKKSEKSAFAKRCATLMQQHTDISCHAITVYKPNVETHVRGDSNKLYNYMIGLVLLDVLAKFDEVHFIPDPRSVKLKSGNSLSDYIQTKLWFEKLAKTRLLNRPGDSTACRGVQFSDMLSGTIQQHFEDAHSKPFNILEQFITVKKLYF